MVWQGRCRGRLGYWSEESRVCLQVLNRETKRINSIVQWLSRVNWRTESKLRTRKGTTRTLRSEKEEVLPGDVELRSRTQEDGDRCQQ